MFFAAHLGDPPLRQNDKYLTHSCWIASLGSQRQWFTQMAIEPGNHFASKKVSMLNQFHIKTTNSLESMKRNQKRKPTLAGTQCRDRSWKSLKVQWMCSGVNAATKENGHTPLSPVVSPLVHQWAWRQSVGPKKPKEFLQELGHLLKR